MDLDYALLAQNAEFTPDGRLHVFGGSVEHYAAAGFPSTGASLVLVLRLLARGNEHVSEHTLNLELRGPDGKPVNKPRPVKFRFNPPQDDPPRRGSYFAVIGLQEAVFPAPGEYQLRISVDDQRVKSLPLTIHLAGGSVSVSA